MFFYSPAPALAQPVWDQLHAIQEAEIGERIVMATGLGMTESGAVRACSSTAPTCAPGDVGRADARA